MADSSSILRGLRTKDPEEIQSYVADTASSLRLEKEKSDTLETNVETEESKGAPAVPPVAAPDPTIDGGVEGWVTVVGAWLISFNSW
jgi:hypothetical protein